MKTQITRKQLNRYSNNIVHAGYCKLQFLLSNYEPFCYSSNSFGWAWDAYNLYGVVIATGYNSLPGRAAAGITEYEEKARAVYYNDGMTWDEKRAAIDKLLREFCELNRGF